MATIPDQFQPYQGIFDRAQETFNDGYYNGTLFRFPLRHVASELSSTVYDKHRVQRLFDSFQADACWLLIFLKNIERVVLYNREKGKEKPIPAFEVRIAADCLENVRTKRRNFSSELKQPQDQHPNGVTLMYVVIIETLQYHAGQEPERQIYKWLLNEHRAGTNMSTQLQILQGDSSLSLVPLVGVAMEIGKSRAEPERENSQTDPDGQIFCFLPLPVEQKSPTGLPVHVNGYFALSQNRRHPKWPTAGQSIESDKCVLWNQCLIQEVLPISYSQLVIWASEMASNNPDLVKVADVYRAMPDLLAVDEKWNSLLPPLYERLLQHHIAYSPVKGGCWVSPSDAVFDCLKENRLAQEAISCVLGQALIFVSRVPRHLLDAIGAYSSYALKTITPNLVRRTIQQHPSIIGSLSNQQRLCVLIYILQDEDECFHQLEGITLLPLADGTMASFRKGATPVYLPNLDCPRELFPGLEFCLIAGDLDDLLMAKLARLAEDGKLLHKCIWAIL